jgi:MurNAc alpha-1-phosphate uridylyltransferase
MVLAAGYGERMRPLTDRTPKPLLCAGGKPLLQYHLERLQAAGLTDLVVNLGHLGEQIKDFLGDGGAFGVRVRYSHERQPLETAGGIVQALPWLGDREFLVVNGDIHTDYPFQQLATRPLTGGALAHLVMVDNPDHHAGGDFVLGSGGRLTLRVNQPSSLTYAGIARFHPALFRDLAPGVRRLRPVFEDAIAAGQVTGEHYLGRWTDVGTPERLAGLDKALSGRDSSVPLL